MMIEMVVTTALTALNVLLLIVILWWNACFYRKMKADYTLFLLVFAGLFLLENLLRAYFLFTRMEFYVEEVAWPMMFLTGLQTVAFALLLWMQRQ